MLSLSTLRYYMMSNRCRLLLLSLAGLLCLSFHHEVIPWISWWGLPSRGVISSSQEVDYWSVVYHPNKDIIVHGGVTTNKFVPHLVLVDGAGNVVDTFTSKPNGYVAVVTMPPDVPATNILRLLVSPTGGTLPAAYKVWKQ